MSGRYPAIVYTEEGMREGMQIEMEGAHCQPLPRTRRAGSAPFEVDGDWPWNEAFFPKPSTIQQ